MLIKTHGGDEVGVRRGRGAWEGGLRRGMSRSGGDGGLEGRPCPSNLLKRIKRVSGGGDHYCILLENPPGRWREILILTIVVVIGYLA